MSDNGKIYLCQEELLPLLITDKKSSQKWTSSQESAGKLVWCLEIRNSES